jgi:hypothetical protein
VGEELFFPRMFSIILFFEVLALSHLIVFYRDQKLYFWSQSAKMVGPKHLRADGVNAGEASPAATSMTERAGTASTAELAQCCVFQPANQD